MPSRRSVLAGAGTLAGAGLAGCLSQNLNEGVSPGTDADTEWPQPGGTDRYDCYLKDAAAPQEEPSKRWTAETNPHRVGPSSLTAMSFCLPSVACSPTTSSPARRSGDSASTTTGGEGFVAAFAMGGGIGVGNHRVGYERWRHDVDGKVFEGVSIADGAVFATASDGDGATLYALK